MVAQKLYPGWDVFHIFWHYYCLLKVTNARGHMFSHFGNRKHLSLAIRNVVLFIKLPSGLPTTRCVFGLLKQQQNVKTFGLL